jgi:hypothetical protein
VVEIDLHEVPLRVRQIPQQRTDEPLRCERPLDRFGAVVDELGRFAFFPPRSACALRLAERALGWKRSYSQAIPTIIALTRRLPALLMP